MSILNDTMTLAGGVKIPRLGFGTWQIPEGEACYDAVSRALEAGYRHIDTARAYGNEKSVGRAVRNAGLAPEEVFITSKLPAEEKGYDAAWRCFEATMEDLGMETLDLYLIHAPWPWSEVGADYTRENIETWRAMEEIGQSGRCRAVGVSNFSVSDLKYIRQNAAVDFTISDEDMAYLDGLTDTER